MRVSTSANPRRVYSSPARSDSQPIFNVVAPALARRLRRELADRYGDEYGETAALIGEVRAETRPRWPSFAAWAERWQAALDDRVVELVRRGERDAARALLLARLAGPR